MPRLSMHPVPKKRYHGGRWRIYWKWNSQQFSVATKHADPKKIAAVTVDLRHISAALAMDHPVFPDEYQDDPAVIRFDAGLIVVTKTKTRKSRTIPMNALLEQYFRAVPEVQRTGYVVKCPAGIDRLWRMDNLMRKVQKLKKTAMLSELHIPRPAPSRSKEYKAKRKAYDAEKQKRAAIIDAAVERLGWNAWRHTFGSLLAQSGVSLDKISSWMGNTPEVCRRHYAQFIPRDRRDAEIDKL